MDEGKLRQQQDRGERAKRLLENELYVEAFETTKADLLQAIEQTTWDESDRREFLYQELRALNHIRGYLQRIMATGENARKELLRAKDPSKLQRVLNG